MINILERKNQTTSALLSLLDDSKARPFLFRTRFERTMIKLQSFARLVNDKTLEAEALNSLYKMRSIVDKSNSTSDGVLRSFVILEDDIRALLNMITCSNYSTIS
jgi:hypothetical protein